MDFVGEAAEAAGDPQGGHGSTFNDGIALFLNVRDLLSYSVPGSFNASNFDFRSLVLRVGL